MSKALDLITTFGVLFAVGLIVYTKIKKQTFNDTILDIKYIFSSSKDKVTEAVPIASQIPSI